MEYYIFFQIFTGYFLNFDHTNHHMLIVSDSIFLLYEEFY